MQYPWEDSPRRNHQSKVSIPSFFIDKTPVTNAEFKRFLDATKYHPKDDHNFLRDWKDGTYPAGWEQKPVTWISSKMPVRMRRGPANVCRMNGNGNTRPRERWTNLSVGQRLERQSRAGPRQGP